MNAECPHITKQVSSLLEIKQKEKINSCENCKYAGPNLWICMQRNCLQVGCSEQANDHSTQHFKLYNSHCIHLNLSSQRLWCYLCEKEVFLGNERTIIVKDPFNVIGADENDENENRHGAHDAEQRGSRKHIQGLVGLQNLANTCYMNSALQALSNIQPLTYYFLDCADLVEHTIELASNRKKTGLAISYLRLMKDIWCSNNADYIAPRGILYGIRSVHPMFRGFQQHDTQEFLRCFMDQLHEELKEQIPKALTGGGGIIEATSCRANERLSNSRNEKSTEMEMMSHNSKSESTSQSEAEYETCDSGVSEQSSLDDSYFHTLDKLQNRLGGNSERSQKSNQPESSGGGSGSATGSASPTIHRSIISEVFDGKLLSSVQCLTCDRVSTREETFQDLSLPIPNKDYLNVLHQSQSVQFTNPLGYGGGVRSATAPVTDVVKSGDGGWLSWIWNIFRAWLWGPSITLHDCMASFFSADELKGDNMYSCEKCNKLRTGVKYSRVLNLPEALCIHLKRFRHDLSYSSKISSYINFPLECFDMHPYLHKDCKSNVSVYNLVSVICHYGTVGGGHYTCFARNEFSNRWYEFDDQHVTEVSVDTVQNCQAYVLFYQKRNPQMDLIRAEARFISDSNPPHTSSDIRFFVSREWISRFNTFAEPGPVDNWSMLCPHGGLPPNKLDVMNKIAVPISQQLWDFLYKKFGGGPAINMLYECELCKRAADILLRRQRYELTVFTKYNDMINSNDIFAISMHWLRKWQLFARGLTNKEPGPITNASICAGSNDNYHQQSPIRNVKSGSDYAQINAPLWRFLHGIYGGGPEIKLRENVNEEPTISDDDVGYSMNLLNNDGAFYEKSDTPEPTTNRETAATELAEIRQQPEQRRNSARARFENLYDAHAAAAAAADDDDVDETERKVKLPTKHTKKEIKSPKHFTVISKKANSIFEHSGSKKRTKKRRNALKNSGFFGPNGVYNQNNNENIKNLIENTKFQTNDSSSPPSTLEAIPKQSNNQPFLTEHFQTDKLNPAADGSSRSIHPSGLIVVDGSKISKRNYRTCKRKNKSKTKSEYSNNVVAKLDHVDHLEFNEESSETEV